MSEATDTEVLRFPLVEGHPAMNFIQAQMECNNLTPKQLYYIYHWWNGLKRDKRNMVMDALELMAFPPRR